MITKIALLISVKHTTLNYSNRATSGVDAMANNLKFGLSNAFSSIRVVQNQVKKNKVIQSIEEATIDLDPGGFCLIYFHGHGDSIIGYLEDDELKDEALVCYDGYLIDDELDYLLRGFHSTCRILTIFDCCSSETVIEWKQDPIEYPQIIHLASAVDEGYAQANTNGGLMSQEIYNLVYQWGFSSYTFTSFINVLEQNMERKNHPIQIRKNPNVSDQYLSLPLFT